jgi:hypothetical protein
MEISKSFWESYRKGDLSLGEIGDLKIKSLTLISMGEIAIRLHLIILK